MPEESLAELFDRLERQAADAFHAAADAAPALWDGQQWQRMWDSVDQMTREVFVPFTRPGH